MYPLQIGLLRHFPGRFIRPPVASSYHFKRLCRSIKTHRVNGYRRVMANPTKPKKNKKESLTIVLWVVALLFLIIVIADILVQTPH